MTGSLGPAPRRPVRLEIDAAAITANTRSLASRTRADLLAVVKGDGYGHGAATLARAAVRGGARWVGVTDIDEAVRLREEGIGVPILSWLNSGPLDVAAAEADSIDLAVGSFDDLDSVARSGRGVRVHVSVDTGLAREGFAEADWEHAAALLAAAEKRRRIRVVGLMSHLAAADAPSHPANAAQRRAFARALAAMRSFGLAPTILHLAATAATLTAPDTHRTLTRVGAGLVGVDLTGTADLATAMTLTAPLLDVREVGAGTASGYGHLWSAPQATRLGLVPVGYADGLPRAAAGRAEVAVRGRRVAVVGAISMNALVVDLGPFVREAPGDTVTVFGAGGADPAPSASSRAGSRTAASSAAPGVAEWAAWAGTLPQEVLAAVGRALPRTVVGAGERSRSERRSA